MKASPQRGFSLLEAMVASSILLAGLCGIAEALPQLATFAEHQQLRAHAAAVARNIIEDARSEHDRGVLRARTQTVQVDEHGDVSAEGRFLATREVTDGEPVATARMIRVTVQWSERGRGRQEVLLTFASRRTEEEGRAR